MSFEPGPRLLRRPSGLHVRVLIPADLRSRLGARFSSDRSKGSAATPSGSSRLPRLRPSPMRSTRSGGAGQWSTSKSSWRTRGAQSKAALMARERRRMCALAARLSADSCWCPVAPDSSLACFRSDRCQTTTYSENNSEAVKPASRSSAARPVPWTRSRVGSVENTTSWASRASKTAASQVELMRS